MNLSNSFFTKALNTTIFLLFSNIAFANNQCMQFYKTPTISTTINYGNVIYQSVPKSTISEQEKLKNPEKTLGFTNAEFQILTTAKFDRYKTNEGICVILNKATFKIGYENLDVLIDDTYPTDTCEYKAIKSHEKRHVNIYQKELQYYGELLSNELQNLATNFMPIFIPDKFSDKKVNDKFNEFVVNNTNIKLLREKFDFNVKTKNKELDSDTEYKRVYSLCKEW